MSNREPLLSVTDPRCQLPDADPNPEHSITIKQSRYDYLIGLEDKITKGELMVVRTVVPSRNEFGSWECPHCHQIWFEHDNPDPGEFCKCGSKIIEP